MRKITLSLLATVFTSLLFAQSPRLQLYEEFTGENCGPCAATNPGLHTLLQANTSKIIAVKYQVPIPTDPGALSLYGQSKVYSDARSTYYNVQSAPYGRQDGIENPDPNNQGGEGHPGYFTQALIDGRNSVTSPFSINLTHSFSADYDSVFITCIIAASQSYSVTTAGNLKAHIVLEEAEIHLPAPSGTNGEKDFYDVMRKMLPDANGTTIADSWVNADIDTITFASAIPSYIYDINQIAIVAFIQNNLNKSVLQAAYSAPKQMNLDAGLTAVASIPYYTCSSNSIAAVVTLKNYGITTLTTATISYRVDNGTTTNYAWSGTLLSGATTSISLPNVSLSSNSAASHTFYASSSSPNVTVDLNKNNDQAYYVFYSGAASSPINERFASSTSSLPNYWSVSNPDDGITWGKLSGSGNYMLGGAGWSNGAMGVRNAYNSVVGEIDELITSPFSTASISGTQYLSFFVAYSQFSSSAPENDQLDIEVSTDCGSTWTNVFSKAGDNLKTAEPYSAGEFLPLSSQWRKESVNFTSYVGQSSVQIKYKFTSDLGNDIFIDDMLISSSPTSISELNQGNEFVVFPNPFSEKAIASFNLKQASNVKLNIYNLIGETVYSIDNGIMTEGKHTIEINATNLESGIYFVNLIAENNSVTSKVVLNK